MTSEQIVKQCQDMNIGERREFTMDRSDSLETLRLVILLDESRTDVRFIVNRSGQIVEVSAHPNPW